MIVKTFLEIGLAPATKLRAADGAEISVRSLLSDLRARIHLPQRDTDWYDAAWWISALELDPERDDRLLTPVREAALARLEADDAVLAADAPEPFAPTAPMGAAKRNKSHIYGHPCGGLHFVQAVLRAASASDSAQVVQFTPMALQAYAMLEEPNADLRYHAAILNAQVGRFPEALALADSILAANPDHLFGYVIRGDVARLRGDSAGLARARAEFEARYARETARQDRVEYVEHRPALDEFRK